MHNSTLIRNRARSLNGGCLILFIIKYFIFIKLCILSFILCIWGGGVWMDTNICDTSLSTPISFHLPPYPEL